MSVHSQNEIFVRVLNDARLQFIGFSLIFYVLCAIGYSNFVIENYSYMGFPSDFVPEKAIFSFVLFFFCNLILFLRSSHFIKGFAALFILIFILPILLLFQYNGGEGWFVFSSILLLVLINSEVRLKLPKTIKLKSRQHDLALLLLTFLMFVPFLLTYKVNIKPSLFLMGSEIYEVRAAIHDHGNILTSYMLSPLVQIVVPILAVYGISARKFYLTGLAIVLSMVIYLMIPQKSIFLGIFVVVFFYFNSKPIKKVAVFASLLVGLMVVGMVLYDQQGHLTIESLLLRRYLIIPAHLNNVYYDFFNGESLHYSYSFLKNFYSYPYDLEPSYLIGKEVFKGVILNANNGFLSDGHINFGLGGLVAVTLIVALLVKFFDSLNINAKFFGIFFLLLNLFRSSALPTILLTHGMWLLALIGFFFLRNTSKKILG